MQGALHRNVQDLLEFLNSLRHTSDAICTCITCIYFHYPIQHLESGDSKGTRDAHEFRYPSGRGNVHLLHNGQPDKYNHVTIRLNRGSYPLSLLPHKSTGEYF